MTKARTPGVLQPYKPLIMIIAGVKTAREPEPDAKRCCNPNCRASRNELGHVLYSYNLASGAFCRRDCYLAHQQLSNRTRGDNRRIEEAEQEIDRLRKEVSRLKARKTNPPRMASHARRRRTHIHRRRATSAA